MMYTFPLKPYFSDAISHTKNQEQLDGLLGQTQKKTIYLLMKTMK